MINAYLDPFGINTSFKDPFPPAFDFELRIGEGAGLPSSGPLSLFDISVEFSDNVPPYSLSEFYGSGGAPASGPLSISDFYGRSS